ncbi:hypothetical protein Ahy_A02g009030 isoform B [Arachis hypogaea]|uniref:Uncharacterized protein n=1 Tax=Arachis hypogaea TaxID=3818 RepID=A0A445EG98_ARAHY|nr:hypothetical protein Ahy_A02g009030 isoform B [Arachis hypogaea]
MTQRLTGEPAKPVMVPPVWPVLQLPPSLIPRPAPEVTVTGVVPVAHLACVAGLVRVGVAVQKAHRGSFSFLLFLCNRRKFRRRRHRCSIRPLLLHRYSVQLLLLLIVAQQQNSCG